VNESDWGAVIVDVERREAIATCVWSMWMRIAI